jgi:dGTPase
VRSAEPCPRQEAEERERHYLGEYATPSTDERAKRREHPYEPDDFRTEFERDYTRIIHSRPFRRLRHKTQVFVHPRNDHICTRLEHSLHVASVAKTIAKTLHLNTELVNAIAVGHDLGHAPFGHEGERCLKDLAKRHRVTDFEHEVHSLRVVDTLESPYLPTHGHPGLNLTFAVRDGIACHYGEGFEPVLEPDTARTAISPDSVQRGRTRPATLEGCVVRWADKVAYMGRDLEDAYTLGVVGRDDTPEVVRKRLGIENRDIIRSLIRDIVTESRGRNCIRVSRPVCSALDELYQFSIERIYQSPEVTRPFKRIGKAMDAMFAEMQSLVEHGRNNRDEGLFPGRDEWCIGILQEFLEQDIVAWREERGSQPVLDFMAGMTDAFFIEAFRELFLPSATA